MPGSGSAHARTRLRVHRLPNKLGVVESGAPRAHVTVARGVRRGRGVPEKARGPWKTWNALAIVAAAKRRKQGSEEGPFS
jgi:hypothetical protein